LQYFCHTRYWRSIPYYGTFFPELRLFRFENLESLGAQMAQSIFQAVFLKVKTIGVFTMSNSLVLHDKNKKAPKSTIRSESVLFMI
jgi:hypothetical protein